MSACTAMKWKREARGQYALFFPRKLLAPARAVLCDTGRWELLLPGAWPGISHHESLRAARAFTAAILRRATRPRRKPN